jgi:putative transposase
MSCSYRFKLSIACVLLGFSRQAYYQPLTVKSNWDTQSLQLLVKKANKIRKKSPTKGCRAMYESFGHILPAGRDKSINLLMSLGYQVRYPKRYGRATQAGTREFPNLLVQKIITNINEVWQADMAHYMFGDKKYYTMYITDVYSQEVVGYGAYSTNLAINYMEVLQKAIRKQKRFSGSLQDLIHHSDGGKQYESSCYKRLCGRYGIKQSMCMYSYENPYAEKTNDLINNGYLNIWKPKTLEDLRKYQKKAVGDHNLNSKKKVLDKLTPVEFKNLLKNNQLCDNGYKLELKPLNPEQPKRRVIQEQIF